MESEDRKSARERRLTAPHLCPLLPPAGEAADDAFCIGMIARGWKKGPGDLQKDSW